MSKKRNKWIMDKINKLIEQGVNEEDALKEAIDIYNNKKIYRNVTGRR